MQFSRGLSFSMSADAEEYDPEDDLFTVYELGYPTVSYSVKRGIYEGE